MLRATALRLFSKSEGRYPYVIEFHRLPWKCIPPSSPLAHQFGAGHYHQMLSLGSRVNVPLLVNDFHPTLDDAKARQILPGLVYLVPEVRTLFEDPSEWGPYGWSGTKITNAEYSMYYGPIDGISRLQELWEFTSPDLHLLCTAACFSIPTGHCCSGSSLAALQEAQQDFVLFHFYRPNRPVSELVRPLEKFYVQKPCMCKVVDLATSEWTPAPEPKRAKGAKASPMPLEVPEEHMNGIPEREAFIPGHCFGTRKNAWGMGF